MKRGIVLLVLGSTLFCTVSCTGDKKKEEIEEKYTVTEPIHVDTSFNKEYVSQIRSLRNIEIRAQEKGYLENIYVDEGQQVKTGQLLFRIMPKIYEAEFQKAQAESKMANIEYQNAKSLGEKNIISDNEVALAKAKLDHANAETAIARLHLSFTEIRAPFDGIIDRIPLKLGSLVDEGELLTSLSDNSQMLVYFNVSEPEYLDYESHIKDRGTGKVSLILANNQMFKYEGNVEVVEGEFDNETGNIAFRARFANRERLLRNGQTGKVRMTVPLNNALIIPQKATYELQDRKYVFVVGKDGIARSKHITISGELPDLYIVSKGLSQHDKILLEGVQKVKDDDKIHYEFVPAREVMAHLRLKAE